MVYSLTSTMPAPRWAGIAVNTNRRPTKGRIDKTCNTNLEAQPQNHACGCNGESGKNDKEGKEG